MNKILMIEDEPDQIKLVTLRLEANGYHVLSAVNAQNGIRLAQQEEPDLILLDMLLPDMNGLDVAGVLKKDPGVRDIPIIAMTAVGTPDIEQQCIQAGISGFVRKPYDSQELLAKIKERLEA
ncbi:MAG: response regulator [Candidatus Saelkia tenebricola]|nr:response regulator [Candidatus Saelkia tenebricola]